MLQGAEMKEFPEEASQQRRLDPKQIDGEVPRLGYPNFPKID